MGLLGRDESFTTQIPWWPLISILGTFSAGKSTFINHFLGQPLQRTGNQAVDDRFTVICYSQGAADHALPGVALNSDPRLPLYQISRDIESVAGGEGERIDAYLQLKVSPASGCAGASSSTPPDSTPTPNATRPCASSITSSTCPTWCWSSSTPATRNPGPCATPSSTWWAGP